MTRKITIISALMISSIFLGAFLEIESIGGSNGFLDLGNLFNYEDQEFQINTQFQYNEVNPITDMGATLGRVLFYDKELSVNNSTSCASCHQQENAFGDSRIVALGFEGKPTLRHPMRLINVDFGSDNKRFWDERVTTLENLTTLPIQDTIEMGFSGLNGYPGIDSLLTKLSKYDHYKTLFNLAFGDEEITEKRIGDALAQFIRSIISFDSKFDEGYAIIGEEKTDFPNFTDQENRGKHLFFTFPNDDNTIPQLFGSGCGLCHKPPSMSIIHLSGNNGVIGVAGQPGAIDLTVERSPSLKDLVKPDGGSNGPFMHDGSLEDLDDVIEHYVDIPFHPANTNLGGLLFPQPNGSVFLNFSDETKADLKAFLLTLSGRDVYVNPKWSDPFDENGNIILINNPDCESVSINQAISICEGEAFEGYSLSGIYQDTFSINGICDSIRVLNLQVLSSVTSEASIELCEGESHQGFTESGTYTLNEIGTNGCDSIISLELMVTPVIETNETVEICAGQEYMGFTDAGNYNFNEIATNGCDSIHTLALIILDENDPSCLPSSTTNLVPDLFTLNQNISNDVLNGNINAPGEYQFNIFSANGQRVSRETKQLISSFEININELTDGLFYLLIEYENKYLVESFIKI